MDKKYLFTLPVVFVVMSLVNHQPIHRKKESFHENWNVDVGKTTFRTNVSITQSYVVIGSNGDNYRDANITDNRSGVHIINRKTGKRIRDFANESFGDLDVNGTLIYQNRIYFGNDNDEFICADFNGNIKYSLPVSGDVESKAVLVKRNGKDVLVFGTEAGELRAIDPKNGKTIWQHFHPNFNGWKMGDNRLVFKIKTHFSSTYLFLKKPVTYDLDLDGTKDLIYHLGGEFYAVNGMDGKILSKFSIHGDWDKRRDTNELFCWSDQSSFIFSNQNGEVNVTIPKSNLRLRPDSDYNSDGYGAHMVTYDLNGNIKKSEIIDIRTEMTDFNKIQSRNVFCNGDRMYHFDTQMNLIKKVPLKHLDLGQQDYFSYFISNQLLKVGNHECIVFLYEYQNTVAFYDIHTGKEVREFKLKGRSEFVPVVQDINKDGKLDLLYADDSNYLTCVDLGTDVQILNK